jgi:3,4-dihydroxy-9,10-secoandrosta-1,3,5(10)-triene-9,17-dione 4,5-dioxygenase
MPIASLGYLRLAVTDLERWRTFAGGFLGLQEVADAHFRMDGHHHRLVLVPAEAPGLQAVGFQVRDARDLDAMTARLDAAGIAVTRGGKADCADRRVGGFAAFADPAGNPIELFHGPKLDHSEVVTPGVSRFVTDDMGMGHVILNVTDVEAAHAFYLDLLGFEERNTVDTPGGMLYFLGCNPRQHTLGLAPAAAPGLLHVMVEAGSLDDVGRALDRARRHEIPMMQTLGRHTNDHMVSFYVWSPDLHAVEFGYDGVRVEPGLPSYEITEGAFWGHHFTPPPSTG